MHFIAGITSHMPAGASQATGMNASSSGSGFQLTSLSSQPNTTLMRGVSPSTSPALGSQTVSTLLQTQDLSQTQVKGGHGGGGGHHGGMKVQSGLTAEEAEESEEAQASCQRKKLTKTVKFSDMSGTAEVDENGIVIDKDKQIEDNQQKGKSDGSSS